jgi:hypothetical protein
MSTILLFTNPLCSAWAAPGGRGWIITISVDDETYEGYQRLYTTPQIHFGPRWPAARVHPSPDDDFRAEEAIVERFNLFPSPRHPWQIDLDAHASAHRALSLTVHFTPLLTLVAEVYVLHGRPVRVRSLACVHQGEIFSLDLWRRDANERELWDLI